MTVAELIEELKKLPPAAPVYVYDGDCARFERVESVAPPSDRWKDHAELKPGAVVVW